MTRQQTQQQQQNEEWEPAQLPIRRPNGKAVQDRLAFPTPKPNGYINGTRSSPEKGFSSSSDDCGGSTTVTASSGGSSDEQETHRWGTTKGVGSGRASTAPLSRSPKRPVSERILKMEAKR